MTKTTVCLSETELNDYLNGDVSTGKRAEIETHLKDCNACLEKLVFAYETVRDFSALRPKGVKPVKNMWKKNLWLLACIAAFALSFFVPRYFVQFLVATILLGSKWIFESVNARILITIYEAWNKGGEKEASKVLGSFKDRF